MDIHPSLLAKMGLLPPPPPPPSPHVRCHFTVGSVLREGVSGKGKPLPHHISTNTISRLFSSHFSCFRPIFMNKELFFLDFPLIFIILRHFDRIIGTNLSHFLLIFNKIFGKNVRINRREIIRNERKAFTLDSNNFSIGIHFFKVLVQIHYSRSPRPPTRPKGLVAGAGRSPHNVFVPCVCTRTHAGNNYEPPYPIHIPLFRPVFKYYLTSLKLICQIKL